MVVLFLGFSSGLPILLILKTLSAWLSDLEVDKSTIGLFAFVFAPYTLKFVWAPFMDRSPLPPFTTIFGRRRGWLLPTQICLMIAIFGLGQTDPMADLFMTALMACLVAFFSASQDIIIDAFRIELLSEDQQGAGAANVVTGYRIGMWVAGAAALYIADIAGWSAAYTVMALLILVGIVTVLLSPEPDAPPAESMPIDSNQEKPGSRQLTSVIVAAILGIFTGLVVYDSYGMRLGLASGAGVALVLLALFTASRQSTEPYRDFFRRNGVSIAIGILAFISLFKASDVLLTLMANPFYLEIGFTKSQIAWVSGTFGFFVTFAGAYIAGVLIYRIGILNSLWISGVLMMASNLMFALQAYVGAHYGLFHLTILFENLTGGMGTTAFVAYLASLCNRQYTAVQYALLTSFMQMPGKYLFVPSSGFLADGLGWVTFFIISSLAGIPALLLLWWLCRKVRITEPNQSVATAGSSA